MKRFVLLLTGVSLFYPAFPQEETVLDCWELGNLNITTDPDDPVNERHPEYQEQYFDWRDIPYYDLNWSVNPHPNLRSPFDQSNNIIITHLNDNRDFHPEDDWELIAYDMGFNLNGEPREETFESLYQAKLSNPG